MNKSVRYPVKELVVDLWHKIYLLAQVHLSGLEFPDDKDTNLARRQLAIEKRLIFDRMNRLVRCVIDCKVFDGDSVGTKAGLDLARALAANSWEAHPAQLQQVPGLGPVSMRKLTSHNVLNMSDLMAQGFEDIERILRKNPPFGKNMLKQLDAFPRLGMNAHITRTVSGRAYERTEDAVSVIVNVQLMHHNRNLPKWSNRIPSITLFVESSDGRIISFWRSNISKVSRAGGLELKIPARLSGPDEDISCYFSCEEIVGTEVSVVLHPNIPASAFDHLQGRAVSAPNHQNSSPHDEFDDEDIADEDMLSILDTDTIFPHTDSSQPATQSMDLSQNFPDIEDVLDEKIGGSAESEEPEWAPVQLENGKWMCNHRCRGGELTSYGRPCTHKCCREGTDKPRPPPRRKKAEASVDSISKGTAQGKQADTAQKSRKRDQPVSDTLQHSQWTTSSNVPLSPPLPVDNTVPITNRKRTKSLATLATKNDSHSEKKSRHNSWQGTWDEDVELIDLCISSEVESDVHRQTSKKGCVARGREDNSPENEPCYDKPQSIISSCMTKPTLEAIVAGSKADGKANASFGSSHYDSDIFEDCEDLPELTEPIVLSKGVEELDLAWESTGHETLSQGVVATYKESKDNGWAPSLSFTTASEHERASDCLDFGPQDEQICPQPPADVEYPPQADSVVIPEPKTLPQAGEPYQATEKHHLHTSPDLQKIAGPSCPGSVPIQSLVYLVPGPPVPPDQSKKDPAWVAEFDPELINEFRPYVEFLDE